KAAPPPDAPPEPQPSSVTATQTVKASTSVPKAAPSGPPSATQTAKMSGGRGVWSLPPDQRGRVLEASAALPGTKINGNFSDFDRVVYDTAGPDVPALEVGQTKSIDTSLPGYT